MTLSQSQIRTHIAATEMKEHGRKWSGVAFPAPVHAGTEGQVVSEPGTRMSAAMKQTQQQKWQTSK